MFFFLIKHQYFLRMRESYKRFVKTWIRFVSWSRILTPKRFVSFRDHESWLQKGSFRFVITNPGFVSYRGSRIQPFSKDSFRGFVSWRNFQKIRFADSFRDIIFKRFDESDESYESSRILSTIDLRIHTNPYESGTSGFANTYGVQKIRFADSFRTTVFKRFVSWIRFVKIFFPNYSIRFVS